MFLCLVALKLQTAPELETDDVQPLLHALQKRSGAMCHGILDIKYSMNPVSSTKTCHPSPGFFTTDLS